jgi:hypothetical protein
MTEHQTPGYDDLEPEGEDAFEFDEIDDLMAPDGDPFEELFADDPTPSAARSFDRLDAFQEEGFFGERHEMPPAVSLADLAAHTALRWGHRTTASLSERTREAWGDALPEEPEDQAAQGPYGEEPYESVTRVTFGSAVQQEAYHLMERLAAAAAHVETKTEPDKLIAAMVPISLQLAPHVYRYLWPALPVLIQGCVGVARVLYTCPRCRPYLRRVPEALRRTVHQLARAVSNGRALSKRMVARTLARQFAGTLPRLPLRSTTRPIRHRSMYKNDSL